ncbi:MAG TPA: PilC/PilY family type IV pilus protein [Burkholderiaceae bacterium]|nr:PilC/PilY family type IV pilus protein [Burkholderiaceae bacterium]
MQPVLTTMRTLACDLRVRIGVLALVALGAVGVAVSGPTPPAIPSIPLAAEPLYAQSARAKPTLTLALSVEYPTVGAQYRDQYSTTKEYIGYFDTESCYVYNYENFTDANLPRFDRSGPATNRTCGGTGFSGNFMNWAMGSSIDILRYGLTGGDRVVDTNNLTVLQRAYLPTNGDNEPSAFWNKDAYFPAKQVTNTVAAGAVPATLLGSYKGDLHIANCKNRIFFGTAQAGSCDAPGNNSDLVAALHGPVTDYSGSLPSDFFKTACASDGSTCSFTGIKQVAYGTGTNWKFMTAKDGTACSTAVFGDPGGTGKKCYTRADPTSWTPGMSYARVSVCGVDGSGKLSDPRIDLCMRYPSGNYKPVGNLQKYSDRVRVAAFGYLIDNGNPQRNGGVLRAPMKYVGPKAFDANFQLVSGANPAQEWNTDTGIFLPNPDKATEGKSGVANYLNQFGRTGATEGNYKRYDPVGELYYEALRYLQGLPPTSSAVSSVTTAMKDGFPVYTTWTDPHPAVTGMTDYSCVRNNIVAIGDVYTHNDKFFPGNTRSDSNDSTRSASDSSNEPDFMFWTKVVGGFESNNSVSYKDGRGVDQKTSNILVNAPYNAARWGMETQDTGSSAASYYMAGAAYWANTHDIRGANWSDADKRRLGMRVTTYVLDVNENGTDSDQATRKQRQYFLTAKYGGFKDASGTGNPFKAADMTDTNANWESQTIPGDPKNYFLASSARAVLDALDNIFANIAKEANSIAGGAISTQRLTSVGGFIFQAQFDPADWSGDLIPYPVTLVGGNDITIGDADAAPWTAAKMLDARDPATRKIYVGKTTPNSSAATEFKWASLDSDTQDFLRLPPGAKQGDPMDPIAVGQDRLDFVRGVRTKEAPNGTLRKRGKVLGDIVNSGVAYSGAPSLRINDAGYVSGFAATYKNRKKTLFVGANDGMLHAFDSDNGDELFGYIPSWLVPRLNALSSTTYQHQTYVDASPVVAEAKVGADWKTVLVGGTGGGGQGVYALDVSDPSAFDASKVMWEFTDKDDASLGNVIGRPAILKFKDSATSYKYYAVVASGVNNYVDDGRFSTTGKPAIFILDLAKAPAAAWVLNSNYYKIELPIASTTIASGVANFTTTSGLADETRLLFAGDLQGNLWKLDFTNKYPTDWTLDKLSFYKSGSTPIPMYIAQDGSANLQPITMAPYLAYGPNRTLIVAFGTGKYLETSDNSSPFKAQSVYALLDNNQPTVDSSSSAIAGRGRLQMATANSAGTITNSAFKWGRPSSDADTSLRAGWYFDMPSSASTGERQISSFTVFGDKVYSGTVIPPATSCELGSGRSYEINLFTGTGSSTTSDVGILGEPFVLAVGNDVLTKSNSVDQGTRTTTGRIVLQGSGSLKNLRSTTAVATVFRMSWRQINNYEEVRAAP